MRIRFGDFVVDRETRQLERNGVPVRLSPKAFQLLEILLEHRPRALSKKELMDALWPKVFVEEENLKARIAEVRSTLGDTERERRYIRTVQRFGYAFEATAWEEDSPQRPTRPQDRLYWLHYRDQTLAITSGETYLGRDPECGIWIDAPGVSRQHARIIVSPSGVTLEDLGSKNGTWVGTTLIDAPTELHDGDRISLGSVQLTFRLKSSADSTISERTLEKRRDLDGS